jgi:class 3 adenylate cyclase
MRFGNSSESAACRPALDQQCEPSNGDIVQAIPIGVSRESRSAEQDAALDSALARIARLERTNAQLSQFVPRSVRRMIAASEDSLVSTKQDIDLTVMFLDVEGYTALSDRWAPQRMAELIEHYFSRFVDAVHEHGGEINETAGDGLMAMFQDARPRAHARRAARAALAVMKHARELRSAVSTEPALTINLGLDSGVASVGPRRFAGKLEVRCTYTATGKVTNRAARLQQLAKGGCALVSEDTARRLSAEFRLCDLGFRELRNLAEPTRVYRLWEAQGR